MIAPLSSAPISQFAGFAAVDWLLLLVLALSAIAGLVRGLIREVFGLAGTIVGLLLAVWNYPALAAWLSRWIPSPVAADITAFVLIAVGVGLACTLTGRLLRGTAHTIGLGLPDRLAGAVFGLLRGALVAILFLVTVNAFFPSQPLVENSRLAPYFLAAAREVCFVVPQDLQKRISGGIASVTHPNAR